jgi:RHS repeat-associated protein
MVRNGEIYYYIADALGSIRTLVDTMGYIRQMYEYNAFGEIVQVLDEEGAPIPINEAITNPYTFTGREYDPETGLYYYRARYYDSSLGRFLQEDPILSLHSSKMVVTISPLFLALTFPKGLEEFHPYIYVTNDPINRIDPTGLEDIHHGPKDFNPDLWREDCMEKYLRRGFWIGLGGGVLTGATIGGVGAACGTFGVGIWVGIIGGGGAGATIGIPTGLVGGYLYGLFKCRHLQERPKKKFVPGFTIPIER